MRWAGGLLLVLTALGGGHAQAAAVVSFASGSLALRGYLYRPSGPGPFPAVLYNHGGAPGLLSDQAFARLGPLFVERGWIFFAPYRRGQGLSRSAGAFIGDQIEQARSRGGLAAAGELLARLQATEQLDDQLAALAWLRAQPFVVSSKVAVFGNSFGGIQALLGAAQADYCAAIDAAGGASSWELAPALRALMIDAARHARSAVFLYQAENDYSLQPSRIIAATLAAAHKPYEMKIYPAFGSSSEEGHAFAYEGSTVWSRDVFRFLEARCASGHARGR